MDEINNIPKSIEQLYNVVILTAKNTISNETKEILYKECDKVNTKSLRKLKKAIKYMPKILKNKNLLMENVSYWLEKKDACVIDLVEINDKEIKVTLSKDFFIVLDVYNECIEKKLDVRGAVENVKNAIKNWLGLKDTTEKITPNHIKKRIWCAFADTVELEPLS